MKLFLKKWVVEGKNKHFDVLASVFLFVCFLHQYLQVFVTDLNSFEFLAKA